MAQANAEYGVIFLISPADLCHLDGLPWQGYVTKHVTNPWIWLTANPESDSVSGASGPNRLEARC